MTLPEAHGALREFPADSPVGSRHRRRRNARSTGSSLSPQGTGRKAGRRPYRWERRGTVHQTKELTDIVIQSLMDGSEPSRRVLRYGVAHFVRPTIRGRQSESPMRRPSVGCTTEGDAPNRRTVGPLSVLACVNGLWNYLYEAKK